MYVSIIIAAMTTDTHAHFLGFSIHLVHILTGMGIAIAIMLPFIYLKFKKSRSLDKTLLSKGRQEVHSERVKSDIILASIEDGVVVVGADKTIQVFNTGAGHITGWEAKDAESLNYTAVFTLLDNKGVPYDAVKDPIAKALASSSLVRDNTAVLETHSKKQIPIYLSISPLLNANKELTGVVVVFRDVSQERQEEHQRAEFISTASHEMRTPVAAIEGYLALALNPKVANVDTKARSYLEKAHSSTQHLGKLFQDLLTSAKAEDGRLANHPAVIEMGALLEQITDSLKFAADKKGLRTEFVLGTTETGSSAVAGSKIIQPLYYSYADGDRLREVITNLFDNAVKYTDNGKIAIGLTGNDQVVQIYVEDTGPGIPPEDIPHLFQKFYRVDSSATRTIGGTGLGLFICRKIIELYSGRIWVESELGKGSTFYINIPRLSSQKAADLQTADKSGELAPITSLTQT